MTNRNNEARSRTGLIAEIIRSGRLIWRLLNDPRVSLLNKLVLPGLAVAYLLWPVDLMPDVFPVLGQLDDLALLALAVKLFIELCPSSIVRQHREELSQRPPPAGGRDEKVVDGEYRVLD